MVGAPGLQHCLPGGRHRRLLHQRFFNFSDGCCRTHWQHPQGLAIDALWLSGGRYRFYR
jgi:hypothetical protein